MRWITSRRSLRDSLVNGPARRVAAPVHDALVAAELAVAMRVPVTPAHDVDDRLTIVIKTFERPRTIRRLVDSIRRMYPSVPIIVVDDSRAPRELPGVETIVLPFDQGVSIGRNAGLDRVRTPYVMMLDDDFVFFHATQLGRALGKLERQPRIDLLGGQLIDLPYLRFREPPLGRIFPTRAVPREPIRSTIDDLLVCDKVANFYIARTDAVRRVGWTPQLRRVDHADFFTRALGVVVSVFDRELRAFHAQTPFDLAYMAHRNDVERDSLVLAARWRAGPPS
jgi:glycosyltransferase involved in cell wall biosynthesis